MVDIVERIRTLEQFPTYGVVEVLDEDREVEYILTYNPIMGGVIVDRIGKPLHPPILISHSYFLNNFNNIKLNEQNKLDKFLMLVKQKWLDTSDDLKMEFFDNIPLNSFIISGDFT